jgi:hypothetical protein
MAELAELEAILAEETSHLSAAKREANVVAFRLVMASGRILRSYQFFLLLYSEQNRSLRVSRRMHPHMVKAYASAAGTSVHDTQRLLALVSERGGAAVAPNLKALELDLEDFCNWFFDAFSVQFDAPKRVPLQLWAWLLLEHYTRVPTGAASAMPPAATQSLAILQPTPAASALLSAHQLLCPSALHSPAASTAIVLPPLPNGYAIEDYTHFLNVQLCFASTSEWEQYATAAAVSAATGHFKRHGGDMQQMAGGVPLLGAIRPPKSSNKAKNSVAAASTQDTSALASVVPAAQTELQDAAPASTSASVPVSAPHRLDNHPISPSALTRRLSSLSSATRGDGSSDSVGTATSGHASVSGPIFLWEERMLSSFDIPVGSTLLVLLKEEARLSVRSKQRITHAPDGSGARAGGAKAAEAGGDSSNSPSSKRAVAATTEADAMNSHGVSASSSAVALDGSLDDGALIDSVAALQLHESDTRAQIERLAARQAAAAEAAAARKKAAAAPVSFYAAQIKKNQASKDASSVPADGAPASSSPTERSPRRQSMQATKGKSSHGGSSNAEIALPTARENADVISTRLLSRERPAGAQKARRVSVVAPPSARAGRGLGHSTSVSSMADSSHSLASRSHIVEEGEERDDDDDEARDGMDADVAADAAEAEADRIMPGQGGFIRLGGGLVRTLEEDEAIRLARQIKLEKLAAQQRRRNKKLGLLGAGSSSEQLAFDQFSQRDRSGGGGGLGPGVIAETFPQLAFHTLDWHEIGVHLTWTVGQLLDHVAALFGLKREHVLDMQYAPSLRAQMLDPHALIAAKLNSFRTDADRSGKNSRAGATSSNISKSTSMSSLAGSTPLFSPTAAAGVPSLSVLSLDNIDEGGGGGGKSSPTASGSQSPALSPWGPPPPRVGAGTATSALPSFSSIGSPGGKFGLGSTVYGSASAPSPPPSIESLGLSIDIAHVMANPALEEMLQAALGEAARLERARLKRHRKALAAQQAAQLREKQAGFYASAAAAAKAASSDGHELDEAALLSVHQGRIKARLARERNMQQAAAAQRNQIHSEDTDGTGLTSVEQQPHTLHKGKPRGRAMSVFASAGSGSSLLPSKPPSRRGSIAVGFGSRTRRRSVLTTGAAPEESHTFDSFGGMHGGGETQGDNTTRSRKGSLSIGSSSGMSIEEIAAATAQIARDVRQAKARNAARRAAQLSGADGAEADAVILEHEDGDANEEETAESTGDNAKSSSLPQSHSQGSLRQSPRVVGLSSSSPGQGTAAAAVLGAPSPVGAWLALDGSSRTMVDVMSSSSAASHAGQQQVNLRLGFRAPQSEDFDFREDLSAVADVLAARREAARLAAVQERARVERAAAVRAARIAADPIGAEFHADDYEEGEFAEAALAPVSETGDGIERPAPSKPVTPRTGSRLRHSTTAAAAIARSRPSSRHSVRSTGLSPSAHPSSPAGRKHSRGSLSGPSSRAAHGAAERPQADNEPASHASAMLGVRWPTSGASGQLIDLDALAEKLARWGSGLALVHAMTTTPHPQRTSTSVFAPVPINPTPDHAGAKDDDPRAASALQPSPTPPADVLPVPNSSSIYSNGSHASTPRGAPVLAPMLLERNASEQRAPAPASPSLPSTGRAAAGGGVIRSPRKSLRIHLVTGASSVSTARTGGPAGVDRRSPDSSRSPASAATKWAQSPKTPRTLASPASSASLASSSSPTSSGSTRRAAN